MADAENTNLLYRPELEPEKNWQSDGVISSAKVPNYPLDKEDTADNTPTKLKEDLIEIKELFEALPDGVQFFEPSIQKVADLIDKTWPDGTIDSNDNKKIYDTSQDKIPDSFFKKTELPGASKYKELGLPSPFPTVDPIDIDIESPDDIVELINETYEQDQIELDKNYIQKLQVIMQQYFQQLLTMKYESGVPAVDYLTKDFDGDSVEIPSGQDLEHLRDYICRSQITRKQKTRLFKKTHSADRTLQHIRSWYASYKERERYYSENYKDSSTYAGTHNNALLRESRRMYDDAYDQSLYSMYKYLNSATMIVNDILKMTLKEAQAKTQLLKSGVDILKTDTSLDTTGTSMESSSSTDTSTANNTSTDTTNANNSSSGNTDSSNNANSSGTDSNNTANANNSSNANNTGNANNTSNNTSSGSNNASSSTNSSNETNTSNNTSSSSQNSTSNDAKSLLEKISANSGSIFKQAQEAVMKSLGGGFGAGLGI